MEELVKFVSEHADEEVTKLLLNKKKWPGTDVELAADCILSRRKLRGKVARWAEDPSLLCPLPLSAEQCSSDETGAYKAALAARIISTSRANDADPSAPADAAQKRYGRIADLTGGLGIDSWYFSQKAEAVLYCEMRPLLARMAVHNFQVLGADHISVRNCAVTPASSLGAVTSASSLGAVTSASSLARETAVPSVQEEVPFLSPAEILGEFQPDLVFMDPARRGEGGKKVFLLEDCTPDVLGLLDELWECTGHILLKLSPMADISMVVERLGPTCREVHVVSVGGECKELLVWMDKNWPGSAGNQGNYELVLYESGATFRCPAGAEKASVPAFAEADELEALTKAGGVSGGTAGYLFEPGKSLMKAGLFNFISAHFGMKKLGLSTHYYLVPEETDAATLEALKGLGKVMPIREVVEFNKRSFKDLAERYPHCEVTARNLPITSDQLRKKMKVSSGDDAHLYALKTDAGGNLIFVCLQGR